MSGFFVIPSDSKQRVGFFVISLDFCVGFFVFNETGRGGGIRTHDHLVPNQVRYQAALRPEVPDYIPVGIGFEWPIMSCLETSMHWRMCCSQTYFKAL